MNKTDAYLALNLLPGIGPIRVRRLLSHLGGPCEIFSSSREKLLRVDGIGSEMAEQIHQWENLIDLPEEKRRIAEHGISLLTIDGDDYPPALREIYDPPFLLYVKGKITRADKLAVGVVGSRRTTHYGKEQAKKLSFQLARSGFTIVSGLARGIDTAAHEAALAARGRTIAVLGSGVGNVYPPENQPLADRIAENGAVISEFPVLYVPDRQSFPLRNRIVSGLSVGLLVVEAPARSGALITANQALEQGRSVFAVPGPIDRPTSAGCNRLIRSGASLVSSASDIVEELDAGLGMLPMDLERNKHPASRQVSLSESEEKILTIMEDGELTIDQISEQAGLPANTVSVDLLKLEMKALVKQLPGKYFTKLI